VCACRYHARGYYRDMGYNFAMMGDSTSRWALREDFRSPHPKCPLTQATAYLVLASRRSTSVQAVSSASGHPEREGSVTIVGAVSPWEETLRPVTAATLGSIRCTMS
jgi:vacuolar-type H+-ATPase catalytic subunit A/Vma1